FTKDTTASILTSGLLGEQYVGLEAGADPEPLQSGDTLMLTQSAVVLEKLIGKFLFSTANESKDSAGAAAPATPAKPAPPGFGPGE
ncbi:MAG: outer membrane lipid asymmetry maintenance protein MlaD, partial [Burkholderiales bacterium]|nr:outer membrane lipid asymmetry maintenance protein MlaD [Burkholderiales bacterium]